MQVITCVDVRTMRLLIERLQPAHALAKSRPIATYIAIGSYAAYVIDEGYGEQRLWLEILK